MRSPTRARRLRFPASAELPVYLTPLIGRDADVAHVCALFRATRLVSLVGAGGSGKTRLAAAVGHAMRRRVASGVAWLDLAALTDPAALASHVAATLGAREQPGRAPVEALIDLLGPGAVLLVLDNCEHVLDASAALADALLRACPGARILTTSRQALGIPGEKAWLVPPLALPGDDAHADASPAVQLFVQRAADVQPGFALTDANAAAIVHVCRRLDGLPLAIELAAARVRMMPPAQLAERLDSMLSVLSTRSTQRLPRHRTLRALIDWSYALLTPDERRLLGRLAVFAGGFTLDAAERVASDDTLPADRVLDVLASLVDRSLVAAREAHGEARFTLLEAVRQYAWQTVLDAGETEAVRARHAAYFVEFAETAEPHVLGGSRGMPWMARCEQEHGNLRAAIAWCDAEPARAPLALRIGAALLWYDFALGQFDEPRHVLQRALDRAEDAPPHVRGRALTALGYMALWAGDTAAILPPLGAAVELLRTTDRRADRAFALIGLGAAAGLGGDADTAYRLFDEAEAALGSPREIPRDDYPLALLFAFGRYWRGTVALAHGDLALARASYQASVDVARAWGSHPTIAHPLAALARVLVLHGELDAAHALLAESITIHARHDDRWGVVQALDAAALLFTRQGELRTTAHLLGATDRLRTRSGIAPTPPEQAQHAQLREAASAALGQEAFAAAYAEGEAMPLAHVVRTITKEIAPARPDDRRSSASDRRGNASDRRGSASDRRRAPASASASAPASASVPVPASAAAPASVPLPAFASESDLSVRALGPLEIRVHGNPLAGDAFGSSKPRELLLLLLCHPEGRTREQVGLEFWPDASAVQVKNTFHVTLHRLRRALGQHDWITIVGDRYRIDPALRVAFDVATFREGVTAYLRKRTGNADALAGALQHYRGDFLAGEVVGDWHLPVREELQRLYRDGLRALGSRRMEEDRLTEAADAFRALLAVDPLDEAACRALMTCHARAGLRVEAIRLYENVARLLSEQLGAVPSAETAELYRRLQQTAGA